MRLITILLSVMLIAGCSGAPVGYGGTHKVLFKNDSTITIQYDAITESQKDVNQIASNHCATYDKKTKISGVQSDPLTMGLIKTFTYSCY